MIEDEWLIERWVRDLVRYTPLSEIQARAVVAKRGGHEFEDVAEELDVDEKRVWIAWGTAKKVAERDETTRLLFILPRHEWENLDLYPDAAIEVARWTSLQLA